MPLWWLVVWRVCTRVLSSVSTPRKRKHCTVKPSTLFSISDYYVELKTDAHCPQICPFKGLKKPKKILAQVHKCQLKPTKKSFGIQIKTSVVSFLFFCSSSWVLKTRLWQWWLASLNPFLLKVNWNLLVGERSGRSFSKLQTGTD